MGKKKYSKEELFRQKADSITTANMDKPWVSRALNSKKVLKNTDGTKSSHVLSAEVDDKGDWHVFPTLDYENDSWLDMRTPEGTFPKQAFNRAINNNLSINFGQDGDGAIGYSQNGLINHNNMAKKRTPKKDPTFLEELPGVFNKVLSNVKTAGSPKAKAIGMKNMATVGDKYRDADGETLGENIFEFIDPTGISSWGDVYRSYQKEGLLSENTLTEIMGTIPMGGKMLKPIVKGTKGASALLPFVGARMKSTYDDLENVYNETFKTRKAYGGRIKISGNPINMAKKKDTKKKLKMKFGGTAGASLEQLLMQFMGNGQTDPTTNFNQIAYDRQVNTPGFVESPDATLADNQIRTARAQFKSESNPYTQGLDMISDLAISAGSQMMNSSQGATLGRGGEAASTEGFGGSMNKLFGGKQMKAFGGKVNGMPVEVEGGEVGELPNGQMVDFEGPSHENGGIDTVLPAGTNMHSKRIKIDGKSMAERKKIREKKLAKFKKKKGANPTDALIRNAHERQSEVFDAENAFDMQLQEQIAAEDQELENYTQPQEFKYGGPVLPFGEDEGYGMKGLLELENQLNLQSAIPGEDPTVNNLQYYQDQVADGVFGDQSSMTPETRNRAGDPTFGDALGIYGNLKQAYDPYKNTLENRAGDTPNINPYLDYGKTALAKIQDSKQGVKASKIQNDRDLTLARNTIMTRGRNGARGINTKRALDIAADTGINAATSKANVGYAGQLAALDASEAELLLGMDGKVMAGEGEADLNNRKDRDMFYQNIGKDKAEIGKGLSRTAKSINQIKARGVNSEMLNGLADYLGMDISSGKAVAKENQDLITDRKNRRELEAAKRSKTKSDLERLAGTTPEKVRANLFAPQGGSSPTVSGSRLYSNVKMADVQSELSSKGLSVNLDDKEDVRRLQKLVGAKVDGDFGKNTMEAIKKYKKK